MLDSEVVVHNSICPMQRRRGSLRGAHEGADLALDCFEPLGVQLGRAVIADRLLERQRAACVERYLAQIHAGDPGSRQVAEENGRLSSDLGTVVAALYGALLFEHVDRIQETGVNTKFAAVERWRGPQRARVRWGIVLEGPDRVVNISAVVVAFQKGVGEACSALVPILVVLVVLGNVAVGPRWTCLGGLRWHRNCERDGAVCVTCWLRRRRWRSVGVDRRRAHVTVRRLGRRGTTSGTRGRQRRRRRSGFSRTGPSAPCCIVG